MGEVDVNAALLQELHSDVQHRQRLETEEVELHQSGRFNPFHVELRDRHVRFRIAIHRHQLAQRPVADHDAGGVGRGVARQTFEALRNVECACDHRIFVAECLQLRLALDRSRKRHRRGRILRHEFRQAIDLPIGHLQHATHVAQHAARLQRTERNDLPDLIAAVALLHIADHFAAAVLTEVDVEVRHRHAFRIEEALEQQPEADRIEVRNRQRIGHQRPCTRAAARTDRNALRLGPLDEVRHDQEVTRIVHAGDDIELEGETLAVGLRRSIPGEKPCVASLRFKPSSA